tara:strand:- start:200 stop:1033 length:834 start_codon:yes stop_codon:yes gene_type:complete
MRRLQQLLQARIIKEKDVLYFTFKKHIFTGKVGQGGVIGKCTWQKPNEQPRSIFDGVRMIQHQAYVRTFESLTDWTETCIQECLDEYHTRYSSWKRVRHQKKDVPMEVLFKHLQRSQMTNSDQSEGRSILLYEQIASQKQYIDMLTEHGDKWARWFQQNFPDKELPVPPIQTPVLETSTSEPPAAQPFVLHSDTGQYVVLHRINEVAPPECVSWLKANGPEKFKDMLQTIRQPVMYDPAVNGINTWEPVDIETSKRFVHNFFNAPPLSAASLPDSRN